MTASIELMLRLATEANEDDKRMSPVPWTLEPDGWLYSDSEQGGTTSLAEFCVETMENDGTAVARQRNNLRQMGEQLRLAAEELRKLRAAAA